VLYSAVHNDAQAKLWLDLAFAAGDEELAGRVRGALRRQEKNPDLKGAIQDLAIAHEANPADGPMALFYSDVCLRQNDAADAARVLEGALAMTPSAKDVRLGLIALEEAGATPDWNRVISLIDSGRTLVPSDWGWDAVEARMWSTRHEAGKAAALMRHAVQVAQTAPEVADAAMESQDTRQVRALIPSELWMLLEAQAYDVVTTEADAIISRYGSRDMLSAWAHHAKASVQRRTGRDDGGTAEYTAAIATAQAAGGFTAASIIVETISADSGADQAIRQINAYVASADAQRGNGDGKAGHDAQWDLLRIDLFRRNNELSAAAAEIDKLMPRLSELPANFQIQVLRMAVVIYLQAPTTAQSDKAANACLALLQRLPEDVWALNNMAGIYMDHAYPPQPQKALDYGQRAYRGAGQMGEVDPQIADTYGWALAGAGHPGEAIELLKRAADRLDIPDVQYHLAEAYLAAGTPELAGPHLETALDIIRRDQKQGRPVDSKLRTDIANACWRAVGQTTVAKLASWISRCSAPAHTDQ
jgi:tetratricopeptide (TPR) repeat protein